MNSKQLKRPLKKNLTKVRRILAKRLNFFFELLDSEYHINGGGCCFVAYCIATKLKEDKLFYKVHVEDNYLNLSRYSFNSLPDSNNHYSIKLGNYEINPMSGEREYHHNYKNVSPEEILDHYNKYEWNDYYDERLNNYLYKKISDMYEYFTKDLRQGTLCRSCL